MFDTALTSVASVGLLQIVVKSFFHCRILRKLINIRMHPAIFVLSARTSGKCVLI